MMQPPHPPPDGTALNLMPRSLVTLLGYAHRSLREKQCRKNFPSTQLSYIYNKCVCLKPTGLGIGIFHHEFDITNIHTHTIIVTHN